MTIWIWRRFFCMAGGAILPALGLAMDIEWTRMAGQWPVEATPLVFKADASGEEEILVLNRGGQLLLWTPDGEAIGSGQDGQVAQLPAGKWTTAPGLLDPGDRARFVVVSVEGQVVGLDQKFQKV